MKSSMGITKIAAVRFMLVLHLFLNVKMCVVGGGAAGMPSSDSDINYDDGDSGEWQSSSSSSSSSMSSVEGGGRSKELPPSSPWSLGGLPVPSNLIRWNDPPSADPRPHHGHVRSRMHHVRHEQHYLQGHHRASKPNKWHSVSEVDSIHRDGPTVVHDENHQKGRHGHQNHHNKHHNHHRTAGTSSTESSEEASVTRHDHRHRQQLTDFGVPKDVLSIERGASLGPRKHYQQVANRKRSTSNFHSEPPSMNALEHTFPSKQERDPQTTKNATSKSQYTLRSANPESKSYFEYLLNNYKSHSPLYKEHNAQQHKLQTVQPQTRSLTKAKQQRGSGSSSSGGSSSNQKASSSKSSKGKQLDSEYDYSYEDEDDDEVQNDGAYGEVVQTTTSRPRRTTTTVATTTTTTTEASQESSSSSDGDQGSGGGGVGDNQYALFVQSATRMKNTNHRNGNNKFSSHSKHATSPNNPVDPAKQVLVPRPYSSITDFKQANFGTKEAVERSFRIYRNHNQEVQAHLERVARLGACKVPKPKVIPVPSNGTYYFLPERTILHRCDDETACCEPPKRCEAKHTETVTLYFYITTVDKIASGKSGAKTSGKSGPRANAQMKPHVIHMTNHTECHCVQPRPSTTTTEQPLVSGGRCRCPLYFQSVTDSEYECYCTCLNNRLCGNVTEGNESFSLEDRRCIISGICTQPVCKYGTYDRVQGKCPAKREQIDQVIPKNRRNHYR